MRNITRAAVNFRKTPLACAMRLVLGILIGSQCCICHRSEILADQKLSEGLQDLLRGSDPRIRPNYSGNPVEILVGISVASFFSIKEVDMEFGLDMFFRQHWKDQRLFHNLTSKITLTMGTKHPADYIWVPDTVFVDATKSYMHNVLTTNHKIDISADGQVDWGTRATVQAKCHMDFRTFPLDEQKCTLNIVSYAYPTQHLIYNWKTPSVMVLDKEMAQFFMKDMTTEVQRVQYVAGEYSVLQATFTFKRRMGFYLIQIYIPCIAVVFVAWMSLFIDSRATPARVGLCITTLLTISTIWGAVNFSLPRVSYVKAIDVYLMTSFFFVLCTMLEYIGLIHQGRAKKGIWRIKAPFLRNAELRALSLTSDDSSFYRGGLYSLEEGKKEQIELNDVRKNKGSSVKDKDELESTAVDFAARIAFIIAFALFNFFYWFILIYVA
ncbi:gamma-aminobutyric acid receptor subunit beta-like isoform X1 [Porites lutea]|uniref:gamma-aminobutyric acid receptor subunit beta-like isoform X1 n=1 Tax=Porites lutea TaxID=51062 RepID=UPI003CC5A54C